MTLQRTNLAEAEHYAAFCRAELARWVEESANADAQVKLLRFVEQLDAQVMAGRAREYLGPSAVEVT